MKIYYQYSKSKTLSSVGGDFSNEVCMASAFSKFADVFYSGRIFRADLPGGGLSDYGGSIEAGIPTDCDISYVRANAGVFHRISRGRKVWFASPHDAGCFSSADMIVTPTEIWASYLREGKVFSSLNPGGKKYPHARCLGQVVSDEFFPRRGDDLAKAFRKSFGGDFVIGMFGRLYPFTYPTALLSILPKLREEYGDVRFVIGASKVQKVTLPKQEGVTVCSFPYTDMPFVYSACDAMIVPYRGASWDFAGSVQTVEATACGLPVVIGSSPAREEIVGSDYPLFVDKAEFGYRKNCSNIYSALERLIVDDKFRVGVGERLSARGKQFTVSGSAGRIKSLMETIL